MTVHVCVCVLYRCVWTLHDCTCVCGCYMTEHVCRRYMTVHVCVEAT